MLITLGSNPGARGSIQVILVLWAIAQLLVTCVSLMYILFVPGVAEPNKEAGESKVLSFCFWC